MDEGIMITGEDIVVHLLGMMHRTRARIDAIEDVLFAAGITTEEQLDEVYRQRLRSALEERNDDIPPEELSPIDRLFERLKPQIAEILDEQEQAEK